MNILMYLGGMVIFLLLVFFLPFDWWQKAPSRQRETFIGRLLGNYLDISFRNLVLRGLFIGLSVFGLILMVLFLPLIGLYLVSALLISHLSRKILRKSTAEIPGLPGIIGIACLLVLLFTFSVGLLAPLRLFQIGVYFFLGRPAGGFWETLAVGKDWFNIDLAIGFCGIFVITLWLLIDAFWRLRQARQVKNLPTSSVRSLAPGLAELKGTVRPAFGNIDLKGDNAIRITWDMFDYLNPTQGVSRFRLDDGTGSVLVDARECRVRAGWIADIYSIFGVREIILANRVDRDDRNDAVSKRLEYGDTVYVVGNAEINSEAPEDAKDAERLVIRPSERSNWNAMLLKTLFGVIRPPAGKDIHNVFFLSDTNETDARRHILKGFRTVMFCGCAWLLASAGLIWSTYMPQRASFPPDSWTKKYWRGPDTMTNERYRRFEKYIQSLDEKSPEAIPDLIEGLQYSDYRYREKAAFALKRYLPEQRERAGAALPILIEMLENTSTRTVQTPLIVLRGFGPLAKEAVPALIGLLKVNDDIVRLQTVRTLGAIGPDAVSVVPVLKNMLNDDSPGEAEGSPLPEDVLIGEGIRVKRHIHQEIREALKKIER